MRDLISDVNYYSLGDIGHIMQIIYALPLASFRFRS